MVLAAVVLSAVATGLASALIRSPVEVAALTAAPQPTPTLVPAPGLGHRNGVAPGLGTATVGVPGLGHSNGGRPIHGGDPDGVVELSGIWRRFDSTPPIIALRGVDLLVRRGEWLAVVGPSSSGKSTLLNVIGCLDRPDEGSYLLDGIDVTTLTDDQRAGVRSRRIGFVFQSFHLLAHRTVVENIMLAEVYGGQPRSAVSTPWMMSCRR